jgi:hypothetical protein
MPCLLLPLPRSSKWLNQPDELQAQVVEHLRAYLADIEEEKRWDESFKRTQNNLVAAARKAKAEIAVGLSTLMDYEQL